MGILLVAGTLAMGPVALQAAQTIQIPAVMEPMAPAQIAAVAVDSPIPEEEMEDGREPALVPQMEDRVETVEVDVWSLRGSGEERYALRRAGCLAASGTTAKLDQQRGAWYHLSTIIL